MFPGGVLALVATLNVIAWNLSDDEQESQNTEMIEGTPEDAGDASPALVAADFPWGQQAAHAGDYVEAGQAMEPEFLFHCAHGRPARMWLRLSWKLAEGRFLPMSFLLDMAAPRQLYLSSPALAALEGSGLISVDEDLDVQFITLFGRRCAVEPTPAAQQPANIIGLRLLKRLGLQLLEDEPHFCFSSPVFRLFCPERIE